MAIASGSLGLGTTIDEARSIESTREIKRNVILKWTDQLCSELPVHCCRTKLHAINEYAMAILFPDVYVRCSLFLHETHDGFIRFSYKDTM